MPTEMVHHDFWVCLQGCFWKRLAFELVKKMTVASLVGVGRDPPTEIEQKVGGSAYLLSA